MANKKGKKSAADRFEEQYLDLYAERWADLKRSLLNEAPAFAFSEGLLKPYYFDQASWYAASMLEVQPGETVLDMCAAPGGKSLVLALATGKDGRLILNDRSATRRSRLKKVISEHLPPELLPAVTITSHDSTRWGLHEKETYDRVLLDAPCSSERHVLSSPAHLEKWSLNRIKNLAIKQYAMLAASLEAVKTGGRIMYCTCALAPQENDEVIAKLLKRQAGRVEVEKPASKFGEKTSHGIHILPDRNSGMGPMYFCRLIKLA